MLTKTDRKIYANVLADGKIRIASDEGNPDAVKRDYETSDGKKGSKYELVFDKLSGTIKNLFIYEGDYGKVLQITVNDENEDTILCLNMTSNYSDDLLKKLPNVALTEVVEFAPYSFKDDNGKDRKGITLTQKDIKIPNFFYDSEKKKSLNGYPEVSKKDAGKYDSDDWKAFYITARKFMVGYMAEHIIPQLPKMSEMDHNLTEDEVAESFAGKDEMDVDKIPL